ncbi:MAG: aldehyde dehydrogenase family protein [Nitrososphaeria archaeon]|nr:aldehyde dehydrogenase family protein [Nitrososphaeria archaeon]
MEEEIKPFPFSEDLEVIEKEVNGYRIIEVSEPYFRKKFSVFKKIQDELSAIPILERLEVLNKIGQVWDSKLQRGQFDELKRKLAKLTGYSENLIDLEFSFIPILFDKDNIRRNLEFSFKNIEGLHKFVEVDNGEYYRYVPSGPTFIISSGNSLIPPLIPTALSLVTGNMTILKPSLTNYVGVVKVLEIFNDVVENSNVAEKMFKALLVSYFTHDSPVLKYLLREGKLGVINFWGGEPARTEVGKLVYENINHPRFLVNGPLTGIAVIDEENVDDETAWGLAYNIILYDQQLCSSPTSAIFMGSFERASDFASKVAKYLDEIGSEYSMPLKESENVILHNVRRSLQLVGANVFYSKNLDNPWTLVVSKEESALDNVIKYFPQYNIYHRKRFIEIQVVDNIEKVFTEIEKVPLREAFKGVDKVQTIGLAVSRKNLENILERFAQTGVYRIVPLADMFMRSAIEPYDGTILASAFTNTVYYRNKNLWK